MCVQNMQLCHCVIVQDLDCSLTCRQQEQIASRVPTDFIHFHVELCRLFNLECPRVNKADHVLLIADRNAVSIRAPGNVDVLSARIDFVNAFARYWRIISTEQREIRGRKERIAISSAVSFLLVHLFHESGFSSAELQKKRRELLTASIPNPNCSITAGGGQMIWMSWVPTKLINALSMTSELD